MQNFLSRLYALFAVLMVLLALMLATPQADAQTVTQLPIYTQNNPNQVQDLGNGPTEIRVLQGNAQVWVMVGTGVSTTVTASTTMVLQATPAVAPCVGCLISGTGITSGTTVAAYNGTTTITLSAAMTVANGTVVSYGAACPVGTPTGIGLMLVQASVGADLPLYTQGRVCASGQNTAGGTLLQFPIGAH